jgi:hypothetical protein
MDTIYSLSPNDEKNLLKALKDLDLEDKKKLPSKSSSNTPKYNKGENNEIKCIRQLFELRNDKEKLVEIFGEKANKGIEVINVKTKKPYKNIDEIKKAAGKFKADIGIKMIKTGKIYWSSIKSKNCSNPSIVNVTSRSKFTNNSELNKLLPSLDNLIYQYLDDPDNKDCSKSEVDRSVSNYKLDDTEKQDIVACITYFMFKGTGKGNSDIEADAVIEYTNSGINFICCDTEDKKKEYVLKNWDRYMISLRGHKKQKSGKIRGNGLKLGRLEENDKKWVCYYTDDKVNRPRGAITIRCKK